MSLSKNKYFTKVEAATILPRYVYILFIYNSFRSDEVSTFVKYSFFRQGYSAHNSIFFNFVHCGQEYGKIVLTINFLISLVKTPPLPVPSPDEKGGGGTQTAT